MFQKLYYSFFIKLPSSDNKYIPSSHSSAEYSLFSLVNIPIDFIFEGWYLRRIYDIFFFCPGNESANGTRRRLVGNVLCCIECNRSIGGSICSTVCSRKIRFRGNSDTSPGKRKIRKNRVISVFSDFLSFFMP